MSHHARFRHWLDGPGGWTSLAGKQVGQWAKEGGVYHCDEKSAEAAIKTAVPDVIIYSASGTRDEGTIRLRKCGTVTTGEER